MNIISCLSARCRLLAAVLLLMGGVPGCAVQQVGTELAHSLKGEYYLKENDPQQGVEYFRRQIEAHPDSALANYYYGRLLLRSDRAETALPYLRRAGSLDPAKADYQFWTGAAYGSLNQTKQERANYEQALKIDPHHQQALTSLGNYYLRKRQYSKALAMYDRALASWPENPTALYNRGLALAKLGKRQEEQRAWHRYLAVNPSGGLARNAVDHLNRLGDFSYRNYVLGTRIVTVEKITFTPSGAEPLRESRPALEKIGEAAGSLESGVLQVVVYQKNNARLAKTRAQHIRKILLATSPELGRSRIGISWFGEPQRDKKKKWNIEESVDFFLVNQ